MLLWGRLTPACGVGARPPAPRRPIDLAPTLARTQYRALAAEKETLFRELAAKTLTPLPGLLDVLDWSIANNVGRVLVTNAPRPNVDFMLHTLKLDKYFPPAFQVLADDLAHAKPHPLPYLTGLQRLGIAASEGLAFEDSLAGARAAVGANIATVAVLTTMDAARYALVVVSLFVSSEALQPRVGDTVLSGKGWPRWAPAWPSRTTTTRMSGRPLLAVGVRSLLPLLPERFGASFTAPSGLDSAPESTRARRRERDPRIIIRLWFSAEYAPASRLPYASAAPVLQTGQQSSL